MEPRDVEALQTQMQRAVEEFIRQTPLNRIPKDSPFCPELAGELMVDDPVFAFGAADDPMFQTLKRPEVVSPTFMEPRAWMPEAQSVISFFAPFTTLVKESNSAIDGYPSGAWLHARIDGQKVVFAACNFIVEWLGQCGFKALVPSLDSRLQLFDDVRDEGGQIDLGLSFRSNWSERHVAYVCGLGTFSLSRGLITSKGISGRVGTLVTDAPFVPTERPYTGIYEYCTRCGSCAAHCPAHAISLHSGKQQIPCWEFLERTKEECADPYFGCGKCQAGVPCESGIPPRA